MRKSTLLQHGDQSPNPWDLPHSHQNTKQGGKPPRCSGTASGAQVPSLECPILRRGMASITPPPVALANSMSFFHCRTSSRHGINRETLAAQKWLVLK